MATLVMGQEKIPQILGSGLGLEGFQNFSLALGKCPAVAFTHFLMILMLQRQYLYIYKLLNLFENRF